MDRARWKSHVARGADDSSVDRLGFPGMCLADGPAGVRAAEKANGYPAGIHIGSRQVTSLLY
ncbi:glycoside hydrolase family 3 protein [Aureobasidium subglaciale EXF-2481]|uniref:Glycoside hydrolase family 3 protein n=1 Tax=Aureobasidium subglaciale (strain EXF-2481) TaxID=1043005 RepID=A0A074YEA0_AURSE|nr:glycoside hydrolase family 3 protein [Aureobasidium subglaciale EXF-2481]KEQ92452.1 glycoside hydrolase family 3 protein [Aureobasidium subglaciale EXF-2481]